MSTIPVERDYDAGSRNLQDPTVLSVSRSVLSPRVAAMEALRAYPLTEPVNCKLLLSGVNDTYLLSSACARYVIRLYSARGHSEADISYELGLVNHLAGKGVSVAIPVLSTDGRFLQPILTPEGVRYLAVFTYASGKPLVWNNREHSYRAGHLLATIHTAADDFVTTHKRESHDLTYLIDGPLNALRPFLSERPVDWNFLEALATRLRGEVTVRARAGLSWGACHGDFSSPGNFRMAEDGSLTVFDFDQCGPGWRASDLGPIQWLSMGHHNDEIWESFLSGYIVTRTLSSIDLGAVPVFHAIAHLWSLGTRALNTARWGTWMFSGDWYFNWELQFFRTWAKEHFPDW